MTPRENAVLPGKSRTAIIQSSAVRDDERQLSSDEMSNIPAGGAQSAPIDEDALALEFFRRVLPASGVYCAALKTKRAAFRNEFCTSLDHLWQTLREADRSGLEAYFTVASLQSNASRAAENVEALQSFRLDVDYGADGHRASEAYATEKMALEAVKAFYVAAGLPMPTVVKSGGGLHVYWPLAEPLPRADWLLYAAGLKAATMRHGLRADHAITSDAARILRAPCTTNRKLPGKPRKVELDPRFLEIEPYALTKFAGLLQYKIQAPGALPARPVPRANVVPFPRRPDYLKDRARPDNGLTQRFLGSIGPEFSHADAHLIASQCAQLAAMRDTRGVMPEPAWYACIGVLAFCKDGEALVHDWSRGDERYNANQTGAKFAVCREMTGPTRCERFAGLDDATRARCEACPHKGKISTPASLGQSSPVVAEKVGIGAAGAPQPQYWELTDGGKKRPKSYPNTVLAIAALGIEARHDIFHDRKIVSGDLVENYGPELSDAIARAVRDAIVARQGFDPGKDNVQEALERRCEANRFDPVADYLDSLQWDGKPRLDRWLIDYLGAENTPLNRSFGRKVLIAAVRRVRQPGCKFDFMLVLEGPQGAGKSLALKILAGSEENFSDAPIKWDDPQAQQEAVNGVLIYEVAELTGLRKADVEHVKNFLSRTVDKVRPAYGRYRVDRPRRCIFIGTTNGGASAGYLSDPTGARRFWPVAVGRIDLEALRRDRDQLWAEAAHHEARGEALPIDKGLYEAAAIEQERRRAPDTWTDILAGVKGERFETPDGPVERISTSELLTRWLQLQPAQMGPGTSQRVAIVVRGLGWTPVQMRVPQGGSAPGKATRPVRGYERKLGAGSG